MGTRAVSKLSSMTHQQCDGRSAHRSCLSLGLLACLELSRCGRSGAALLAVLGQVIRSPPWLEASLKPGGGGTACSAGWALSH